MLLTHHNRNAWDELTAVPDCRGGPSGNWLLLFGSCETASGAVRLCPCLFLAQCLQEKRTNRGNDFRQ